MINYILNIIVPDIGLQLSVIDPVVGAAIITGVGSVLGSLFGKKSQSSANQANVLMQRETNAANLQAVRETNQANQKLSEYQYQKNLEQWYRENEYQSPKEFIKRLKEAGLSPNLAYGQISNASATSPQFQSIPYQAARAEAPRIQPYLQGGELISRAVQQASEQFYKKELVKYQAEKAKADAEKSGVQTDNIRLEYQKEKELYDNGIWQQSIDYALGTQRRQNENLDARTQEILNNMRRVNKEIIKMDKDMKLTDAEIAFKEEQLNYLNKQIYVMLEENKRAWKLTNAQVKQIGALAGYYIASTKQINELTPELVLKLKQEIENLNWDEVLKQDKHGLNITDYNFNILRNKYTRESNPYQLQLLMDAVQYNEDLTQGGTPSFNKFLRGLNYHLQHYIPGASGSKPIGPTR